MKGYRYFAVGVASWDAQSENCDEKLDGPDNCYGFWLITDTIHSKCIWQLQIAAEGTNYAMPAEEDGEGRRRCNHETGLENSERREGSRK